MGGSQVEAGSGSQYPGGAGASASDTVSCPRGSTSRSGPDGTALGARRPRGCDGRMTSHPVIDVDDLGVRYGDVDAVTHLSFQVEPGELYALLGTNGAGKTSTLEVVEGHRAASSGSVRVLGSSPTDRRAVRPRTGIMLQESGFSPTSPSPRPSRWSVGSPAAPTRSTVSSARRPAPRGADARRAAVRRGEATARLRDRRLRPPRVAVPRRAHDRSRHRVARRALGRGAGAARRRRDCRPDDPLPGGGAAARRPGRSHAPRPAATRGDGRRAHAHPARLHPVLAAGRRADATPAGGALADRSWAIETFELQRDLKQLLDWADAGGVELHGLSAAPTRLDGVFRAVTSDPASSSS